MALVQKITVKQSNHLISEGVFTKDQIETLQEAGLAAVDRSIVPELKPFARLRSNISISAEKGSMGGQSIGAMRKVGASQAEIDEIYKKFSHGWDKKEVTAETLKTLFEAQDKLDYWSGNVINPESVYTGTGEKYDGIDAGAMSVDRIDNNRGYVVLENGDFNFVITTRGFNKMRGKMEHDTFLLWMDEQGLPINLRLIPLLNKLKKSKSA